MKQFKQKEFIRVVVANGFHYDRHNGDHAIYLNDVGRHISIPLRIETVIARRLIKENNLETDIKKLKKKQKMSNAPVGADYDTDAPWNRKEVPEKEIEVLVSLTLSKTFRIKVNDYTVNDSGVNEDGGYFEDTDYSDCNLRKAVEEQILLPHNTYKRDILDVKDKEDLEGWCVDDFEVIKE